MRQFLVTITPASGDDDPTFKEFEAWHLKDLIVHSKNSPFYSLEVGVEESRDMPVYGVGFTEPPEE